MSVLKNLSVTTGVFFFAVFVLSLTSAQNDPELSPLDIDLESMDDIHELLRNVQSILETMVASNVGQESVADDEKYPGNNSTLDDEDHGQNDVVMDGEDAENDVVTDEPDVESDAAVNPNGCSCHRRRCSCCKRIRMRRFRFNKICCLSLQYLRCRKSIIVTLKIGGRTLFRKEVSAKNPQPICTRAPYVGRQVAFCIQLNNLCIRRRRISGCSTFLFRVYRWVVLRVRLGCFRFDFLDATSKVGEVEFPLLQDPRTLAEDPEPIYIGDILMDNIKPNDYKRN